MELFPKSSNTCFNFNEPGSIAFFHPFKYSPPHKFSRFWKGLVLCWFLIFLTNCQDESSSTSPSASSGPSNKPYFKNRLGMEFMLVPPGTFFMGTNNGNDDEKPVHQVTIRKPFYMGKFEVTQAQWVKVMGNNPSNFQADDFPVENVSWDDIQDFLRQLNPMGDGSYYRLPTEAEWEYACRAGTTEHYAGSLDAMAWYIKNSGSSTHSVGKKEPNDFGLYDMHGNVWEWCQDWYGPYRSGAATDPPGYEVGSNKVIRGGGWFYNAAYCRSEVRSFNSPGGKNSNLGFRLVRIPPSVSK